MSGSSWERQGWRDRKAAKGPPTKAAPTNTLHNSQGTAGGVGQSPQCCVLGKETSGHSVSGWRGPEGIGFPVCPRGGGHAGAEEGLGCRRAPRN